MLATPTKVCANVHRKQVAKIREPNRGPYLWLCTLETSYDAAVDYDAIAHKFYVPPISPCTLANTLVRWCNQNFQDHRCLL